VAELPLWNRPKRGCHTDKQDAYTRGDLDSGEGARCITCVSGVKSSGGLRVDFA